MLRLFDLVGLVAALQVDTLYVGQFNSFIDQIANYLVTIRCYADGLPLPHKLTDHARAGVSLTCARRALDWEDAAIQMCAYPDSSLDGRLSHTMEGFNSDAWGRSEQEIARWLVRPFLVQTTLSHVLSEPHKRICHHLSAHVGVCEHRLWMDIGAVLPFLDINRAMVERNRFDLTQLVSTKVA
jgi:hypothetical protein